MAGYLILHGILASMWAIMNDAGDPQVAPTAHRNGGENEQSRVSKLPVNQNVRGRMIRKKDAKPVLQIVNL